jgi:hypothetical protein
LQDNGLYYALKNTATKGYLGIKNKDINGDFISNFELINKPQALKFILPEVRLISETINYQQKTIVS